MNEDNSLYCCVYCGEWQDVSDGAMQMFGYPNCCDHNMVCLDRNLILTITTKGLPKLIDNLGAEITKDL